VRCVAASALSPGAHAYLCARQRILIERECNLNTLTLVHGTCSRALPVQAEIEHRRANYVEILQGIQLGLRGIDLTNQWDHVFWMGDLNYRIDMERTAVREEVEVGRRSRGREEGNEWASASGEGRQGRWIFSGYRAGELKPP